MERNLQEIISKMTLEEKAELCAGIDDHHTKPIDRLHIPSIEVTDGPHGLRKQIGDNVLACLPATCFPTGSALASSWNRTLIGEVAGAIANEFMANDVSVVLGPAMNIKRTPLCGRNFEYLSEDPYLSGEMAASYVKGAQGNGAGACLKHFAANNQEYKRFMFDSEVDERTLREIYLAGFEIAVKKGKPLALMAAYNKINGEFCTENKWLLSDVLRDEWGHEGIVMSDWGAVNKRELGIEAGLDLEMPSSGGYGNKRIIEAVKEGRLDETSLDTVVERMLRFVLMAEENLNKDAACNAKEQHAVAARAAAETMVLLKNENDMLPLKKEGTLSVIGGFAMQPRFQGGGSSHIKTETADCPYTEIEKMAVGTDTRLIYAQGYKMDADEGLFITRRFQSESDNPDEELIREAVKAAQDADTVIIFAGLPVTYESEGFDRVHMRLPAGQEKLIEAIAALQKKTVVVLNSGSAVEMPWADSVDGIIEGYLSGQAFGQAIAKILFGDTNPSGKLAETFPRSIRDIPTYYAVAPDARCTKYREDIFVGYRHYDAKEIEPLFPFGHGLSYTRFAYSDMQLSQSEINDADTVTASLKVKNVGTRPGSEVVQLYVGCETSSVMRPKQELKGFEKVALDAGETKTVTFMLDKRSFAYYDVNERDWVAEPGQYSIRIGASSRDIRLTASLSVRESQPKKPVFDLNSTLGEVMATPQGAAVLGQLIAQYTQSSTILSGGGEGFPAIDPEEAMEMFADMTLRSLKLLSNDLSMEQIEQLIVMLNA